MNLDRTIEQILKEVANLINNYHQNIATAFEKSGYDLNLTIKLNLDGNNEQVEITPSLEFYPEPKLKSEKYTVSVQEKQIELPLK